MGRTTVFRRVLSPQKWFASLQKKCIFWCMCTGVSLAVMDHNKSSFSKKGEFHKRCLIHVRCALFSWCLSHYDLVKLPFHVYNQNCISPIFYFSLERGAALLWKEGGQDSPKYGSTASDTASSFTRGSAWRSVVCIRSASVAMINYLCCIDTKFSSRKWLVGPSLKTVERKSAPEYHQRCAVHCRIHAKCGHPDWKWRFFVHPMCWSRLVLL